MDNIKTILHREVFNLNNPQEMRDYDALNKRLLDAGMASKRMECWATPSNVRGAMEYRAALDALDGREVELETEHLFGNQWNTAPIKGLSDNGLRVFDWQDSAFPDVQYVRQVQWLEQTEEMERIRHETVACGYCGKQRSRAHSPEFCDQCLDSAYLKEADLHLLRMNPIAGNGKRPKLGPGETGIVARYREAQLHGNTERNAKMITKARECIETKYAKAVDDAGRERYGSLWLLDNLPGVYENAIYYEHISSFGFGWRSKLDKQQADDLKKALTNFPCKWRIECSDGSRIEGGQ